MPPAVTIIMPTYERPETTQTAIRSALAQHFGSFVLRIGDDSESDAVERVVRGFDDPRIDYRRNERRLGAAGNWIALLRSADTPYVASLNDDDEWLPGYLEQLVPPLEHDPEVAVAFGDFTLVDEHGRELAAATEALSRRTRRATLSGGRCGGERDDGLRLVAVWNAPQPAICAALRSDFVRRIEFPEQVTSIHDLWLSYQVVVAGGGFYYVPERLTRYRRHGASLTRTVGFGDEEDYVFGRIIAENADSDVVREVAEYWSAIRWGRAVALMGAGDREASQRELRFAAPRLHGVRRAAAFVAGRSTLPWSLLATARAARRRIRGGAS